MEPLAVSAGQQIDHIDAGLYSTLPLVTVEAVLPNANEGASNGKFLFTRTGDTSQPLTVSYALGGSATRADGPAGVNQLTFAAGAASVAVPVVALADGWWEGTETVEASIGSYFGG